MGLQEVTKSLPQHYRHRTRAGQLGRQKNRGQKAFNIYLWCQTYARQAPAGVTRRRTLGCAASRDGRALEPPAFQWSGHEPWPVVWPSDSREEPAHEGWNAFWAHFGALRDMRRPDGVRARAPFVAISSVWSDLWRSKRVSWPLHRSQMSNVSSDAVTAISRELARPGIIWASLHADEGGAAERLRRHPRLRKRAPAACTPRVLRPALWSRWKRSESTPWSVPAVDLHFGRGPKPTVARSS